MGGSGQALAAGVAAAAECVLLGGCGGSGGGGGMRREAELGTLEVVQRDMSKTE